MSRVDDFHRMPFSVSVLLSLTENAESRLFSSQPYICHTHIRFIGIPFYPLNSVKISDLNEPTKNLPIKLGDNFGPDDLANCCFGCSIQGKQKALTSR